MATKLTTCFVRWNFTCLSSRPSNVLAFPTMPSRRPLPASCRIRKRNPSSPIKNQSIKKDPAGQPSSDGNLDPNDDDDSNKENSVSTVTDAEHAIAENLSSPAEITPFVSPSRHSNTINKDGAELGEQPSGAELKNLLDMMRYVEKISDIHLFNKARVRALEDLQNILHEKEALQGEIKVLEKRLTETEAHLKVATQDVNVEILENERSFLESALKDLESKSLVSQESLLEMLSTLRVESKDLRDKVESLQLLLNKATKQANQPIMVLQQNQDLQRKVKRLRAPDEEPVEDMPWEFWSRLLLKIDGWSLEKKLSMEDAKLIREKVWKRSRRILDTYMAVIEKSEHEAISAFLALSEASLGLYVIHIAPEMAPVAKVGGLGDVVSGLGKALQKRGHLVEIILPKYDCMQYDHIKDLRVLDVEIASYFDGQLHKNKIWVGTVEGLPVYFIEPRHHGKFFCRGKFYGEHDDFKRFSYFSRAALEFLHQSGKKPDIIHCHDWPTAFVAPLYWDIYAPNGLNSARICFTCHNFEYQGIALASELASCGLDVRRLNRPDRLQDNKANDRVNLVKGGIVFSNIVTTVSPTYAQELRTVAEGQGLHSTLTSHSNKFIGILNGIDTDAWNPATDPNLKVQYNANDLQGKSENKKYLRRKLGLSSADERKPLVGCVTRLVPHKGVFLIRHAIYRTLELGGQFVLLGSSPIPEIQEEFEVIANNFRNHDHIRLILKYDGSLSHAIYAASDMFIIPSIFEPCGLTQMISMRYGTIPIARKTGGLNDSVFDVEDDTVPSEFQNGFAFLNADEQGLEGALERAFNLYKNNPESWKQLVQKDMNIDFSWTFSAAQYEELYYKSVGRTRGRNINKPT